MTKPVEQMLSAIPSLSRPVLNRLVSKIIEHLDALDGDPDLEDDDPHYCEAGDDGFHPIIKNGVAYWNSGTSHAQSAYDDLKFHQASVKSGPIGAKIFYLK